MVRPLRPETHARPIVQPKPPLLSLLLWDLQPFTPPDALDPLVVHLPASVVQQDPSPCDTIAPILSASSMISSVRRSSSARPCGTFLCVERCCPKARQARRSDTPSSCRTWSMHLRRREGLRSFPSQLQSI